MNAIVKHNLKLITSSNIGGMYSLINTESMGGNAGSWTKFHI